MQCSKKTRLAKKSSFEFLILKFELKRWLIGSLALLSGLGWSNAVRAEGSVNLTSNDGYRPFLDYRIDAFVVLPQPIPRRNVIKVYAESGETINLGSSAIGVGGGRIIVRSPDGSTNGFCGPGGLAGGLIQNRAQETAGPAPNPGGYPPCVINVETGQTGVWDIEFVSPNAAANNDPGAPGTSQGPILAGSDWAEQNTNDSFVTAWDVTVSRGGAAIPGRVYANYLPLNMGGNASPGNPIILRSTTFIQTFEGYLYRIGLALDPYGFIFFANTKGFRDANGNPIFASVPLAGSNVHSPTALDNELNNDITHKIFFNQPSASLPTVAPVSGGGTTWLLNPPRPIPTTTDFDYRFVGIDGTPNQVGPTLGGNFLFNATGSGNYVITIDVNRDDVIGNANDVILRGPATPGLNTIPWDGLDNDGNPVPAGVTPYEAVLTFFFGDVHFPFLDPEANPGGLIIERLTEPQSSRVFYNDGRLPIVGVPPNPISALQGVESSPGGAHRFDGGFGDNNGIDTWTSLVNPITLTGGIVVQQADLGIDKTDNDVTAVAGEPISYTISVTSRSPNQGEFFTNIRGARVTDTVPPDITNVSWSCAITSGTGACNPASGTGNNIDLTVDLDVGATATITVNGTVSPVAVGPLNNTATVTRPPDVNDPNPDNNTDSEETPILPGLVQPAGVKSVRLFTDVDNSGSLTTGDIVEYTINYINRSPEDIINFRATDIIDTEKLTYVSGSYSFSASGAGTTVTANPNYNGTTDPNINTPGSLGANGGGIEVKFQAIVTAPAGTEIINQAIASSDNGTVEPSITDAFARPGEIPQIDDDGIDQGNLPGDTGDDDPTIIRVVGPGAEPARLRLVKRITNITRGGVPIGGINFNEFVSDPNTEDDDAAGWSQLPGGAPVGVFNLESEASLQSGDEVEYTIYFLSDGSQNSRAIRLCDPIPTGTAYSAGSISLTLPTAGLSNQTQTDTPGDDRGSFIPSLNVSPPFGAPPCPDASNPTGAVFVDLGDIPNTAPNNVGFVRFRVRIE